MHKHCSNVCKLRLCLDKEAKNSARRRTIMTAALQQQYSQMELIFWITFVQSLVIVVCWPGVSLHKILYHHTDYTVSLNDEQIKLI
jgi:hypothetical protein